MFRSLPVANKILDYHKNMYNDNILENNIKNMKPVLNLKSSPKPEFLNNKKK